MRAKCEISKEVLTNVLYYFSKNLPAFSVMEIQRASEHPGDAYLYMVIAKRKENPFPGIMGDYSCWTSWNESTQSLNCGHYGLKTLQEAREICKEHFYRVI